MRRLPLLALLVVSALLAVALAGCGSDDSADESSAPAGAATGTATDAGEPGGDAAANPDTPTSSDADADAASPPAGASTPPPGPPPHSPPSPPSASPAAPGGGSSGASPGARPAEARPLPGLPAWTAGYRSWIRLNAAPIPPADSDPHLGTKNVYASRSGDRGFYPPGTVLVKEGFRPGKDFVGLVATMRKLPGRDPEHNDWVFVEWARESADEPFRELAGGDVCTSCHAGVAQQDYVFTTG